MDLTDLGWNGFFEKNFNEIKSEGIFPARVSQAQREIYWVFCKQGELKAEISGKFRFNSKAMGDFPVVGDWVAARMRPEGDAVIIESILPRASKFSRKVAWRQTDEQVLAVNIDTVFIVNGLDNDYSLRRIERYIALARESNVEPVIILNKTDVCPDINEKISEVESVSCGAPVFTISALEQKGIEKIEKYFKKGITVAMLGSSGVGKSTIINCLMGRERQKTGAVRVSDSTGMHITTSRELIILPGGGNVIDNPGLRELQMWADESNLDGTFSDIRTLAMDCRYKDCKHENEPGCAVMDAIEKGILDAGRFQSYIKLRGEISYLATRKAHKKFNEKEKTKKKINKWVKQITKFNKKNRYEEWLADEIIKASQSSNKSAAIAKKLELERQADASR